jgi:hypothetical protein
MVVHSAIRQWCICCMLPFQQQPLLKQAMARPSSNCSANLTSYHHVQHTTQGILAPQYQDEQSQQQVTTLVV